MLSFLELTLKDVVMSAPCCSVSLLFTCSRFSLFIDDASLLPCPQTFLQAMADRGRLLSMNIAIQMPRTIVVFITMVLRTASGQTLQGEI